MLNTNPAVFQTQVDTYIKIVPSGIVLSSLANFKIPGGGTYEITKGKKQTVEFNPYQFSYDIDALIPISQLKFKYYCQVIEFGVETGYPMLYLNQMIDLGLFKNSSKLSMNNNLTCFDSPSSILAQFCLF